jgi:hypothetical protein
LNGENKELNKNDLRVIRGGALEKVKKRRKFIEAYSTDTRLMGVIVVYLHWSVSEPRIMGGEETSLHQYFYVETTEDGIEAYNGIYGDDPDTLEEMETMMLRGLGANKAPISMNEAFFLVKKFAELGESGGVSLPGANEEYGFILDAEVSLSPERERLLYDKICGGRPEDPNEIINYFLMRYFAKDWYPVRMMADHEVAIDLAPDEFGPGTLCLNSILKQDGSGEGSDGNYVAEAVVEGERNYLIAICEIALAAGQVARFEVLRTITITDAEAAMKLARPEYVTVYEIAGHAPSVEIWLEEEYVSALQSETEGGRLYVKFKANNDHVKKELYRLNDDVDEIVYVAIEDQLVVGSYSLEGIRFLEYKLALDSPIAKQLIETGRYEFREPVLYDYTLSYGEDFITYIEEFLGYETGLPRDPDK